MTSAGAGSSLPRAVILDPSDNGPGLARRLRDRGVGVVMLSGPSYAWVTRTRGVDGRVLGPLPQDRKRWLSTLEEIAQHGEGVLIPASDAACRLVLDHRQAVPACLKSFESPFSQHATLMDKNSLYEIADRAGVRRPPTTPLRRASQLEDVVSHQHFPCLLKPALSHEWRRLLGDERVVLVNSAAELLAAAAPAFEAGLELLVSEYVPGPVSDIESAVMLRLGDGTVPLQYTFRKIYEHPWLGTGTLHEACDASGTLAMASRLLDEVDFVGLAEVEAKRHAVTNELVLIEVNVRVPQGFGLGDAVGIDASWRLYATLAGLPVNAQPQMRPGVRAVVASRELRALAGLARRPRVVLARFKSYRAVRDVSGLDLRDPSLLLAFLVHFARLMVLRVGRRLGGARHGSAQPVEGPAGRGGAEGGLAEPEASPS